MSKFSAWRKYILVGLSVVVLAGPLAYGGQKLAANDEPRLIDSVASVSAPPTTVPLPDTIRVEFHGSGTLAVGSQLPTGLYQVGVESNGIGCTWQLLKSLDGKNKSINQSGIVNRSLPDEVTITAADKYFDFGMTCIVVLKKKK